MVRRGGRAGDGRRFVVDQTTLFLILIAAAAIGMVATLGILRGQRKTKEAALRESPFAAATEGMLRCPNCGLGNLVTDRTCSACGKRLVS